jgi:hypothetical protein
MLLFKVLLLTILLVCAVILYRKISRLSYFWSNTFVIIFLAYTCHHFGIKWTTISLLYLSVCLVTFILRALLSSSRRRHTNYYKSIYSQTGGNNFSFYNHGYSKYLPAQQVADELSNKLLRFNKLVLCAFVPLWLAYFITSKTVNLSFRIGASLFPGIFIAGNNPIPFLKNIKAA